MKSKTKAVFLLFVLCFSLIAFIGSAAARDSTLIASLVCPVVGGFANVDEFTDYCIYSNDPPTTPAEVTTISNIVDAYEAQLVANGFDSPFPAGKLEVQVQNLAGCNGSAYNDYVKVYDGCMSAAEPLIAEFVYGHELEHQSQFKDLAVLGTWSDSALIIEGGARDGEDLDPDVDHWNNCLGATFSYCEEVNDYLGDPNIAVTAFGNRYRFVYNFTAMREWCGTTTNEATRGVEVKVAVYDALATDSHIAAINKGIGGFADCSTFDEFFKRFSLGIYTKDLSGLPGNDWYNILDEEEAGNPAPHGPVAVANGGTIDNVTNVSWSGEFINSYGASHYQANVDSSCQVIQAEFTRTAGSSEVYHVVTQAGNGYKTSVTGSGATWTQNFLNDGVTQVTGVVAGLSSSVTADVEFSCVTPVLDIELPTIAGPAYVGASGSPSDVVVQVAVTDGSPTGPIVAGLINSDFKAEIGGTPALILGGGFVQEEYFLLVDTPTQGANGPYDLEVFLEEPGTTNVIASDSETDAIVYDATNTDNVIISDVSGSMGWDLKLPAAQHAAGLYIDASNSSQGLGLASYSTDLVSFLDIAFGTLPHKLLAHTEVNSYTPGGWTSIGDGLDKAVDMRNSSITGNSRCQFTLLSDGMENSPLLYADVKAAVQATGCIVNTVAFGVDSNELLMEQIAIDNGGAAYFNDVYSSAAVRSSGGFPEALTELDLGDTYLYANCESEGCERIWTHEGFLIDYLERITHTMTIDPSVTEATFVIDWWPGFQGPDENDGFSKFAFAMVSPSGTIFAPEDYSWQSDSNGHAAYEVSNPEAGEWDLIVLHLNEIHDDYQLSVFGETDLAVELIVPSGSATGDYQPLFALWPPGGSVQALVSTPGAQARLSGLGTGTTVVQLTDDGLGCDSRADDGLYCGLYTLVTQAPTATPFDEGAPNPPEPIAEGAYQVTILATLDDTTRGAKGSFAVPAGEDSNNDGIPDDFINEHCPGAPLSDNDLDFLTCSDEYFVGTDPNNNDTDAGGENDGSEVFTAKDPLNPQDDAVMAPEFLNALAQNGSVDLTYDVPEDCAQAFLYRASTQNGPWSLLNSEAPLSGSYADNSVSNGNTYYYAMWCENASGYDSTAVFSEGAQPRQDPVNPAARVLINDGAAVTTDPDVVLDFVAYGTELEDMPGAYATDNGFDDITEMLLSNNPQFTGASWQPFAQGVPWQLALRSGYQTVFARFRDASGNESEGTDTATILLDVYDIYTPLVATQ